MLEETWISQVESPKSMRLVSRTSKYKIVAGTPAVSIQKIIAGSVLP